MGFFGRIFGGKKHRNSAPKERRRWSFTRSSDHTPAAAAAAAARTQSAAAIDGLDPDKHAIAMAAATAAVAEAALAAAHAAAEVVRLTRGPGGTGGGGSAASSHRRWAQEYLAAMKIQSAFRGYLARRALRALKALVKLQALVRGHIVRKQTADMLRRMQTLVRLQARARASRSHTSKSFHSISKSSHSQHGRCVSNSNLREIIDLERSQMGSNRLDHWMEESLWNNRRDSLSRHVQLDDEKSDKILEVDTWKPHLTTAHQTSRNVRAFDELPRKSSHRAPNPTPGEILTSKNDPVLPRSAENSPQVRSSSSRPGSSSRRSPFTPTRSEFSWGYFGNYAGYYPNYMSNTESYRAKVRSQSAPKQRLELEASGKRSGQEYSYYFEESSFDQHSESGNRSYRDASQRWNLISSPNLR